MAKTIDEKFNQIIRNTLPADYMANYIYSLQEGHLIMFGEERLRLLSLMETDYEQFEKEAMGLI